jgi:hypothetical protein
MTHDQLERQLRAAADSYDSVQASPDAWLENQRRVRAARRPARRVALAAAAAAVVVAVGAVTAVQLSTDGSGSLSGPAARPSGSPTLSGDDLPQLVGGVEVAHLRSPERDVTVQLTLPPAREPARPRDLCVLQREKYPDGSGSGLQTCTLRAVNPQPAETVLPYLGPLLQDSPVTLFGAVTEDAAGVAVRLRDGDEVDVPLVALGRDRMRGFAWVGTPGTGTPRAVIVYDSAREPLQTVRLTERFGPGWATTS